MDDLKKIKKRSKQGAIMSLIGFLVIICSFIYATYKINYINIQVKEKNNELDSVSNSVKVMKHKLDRKSGQVDSLENIISRLSLNKTYIDKGLENYYSGDFENAIKNYDSAIYNYRNNASAYGLKGQAQIIIRHYTNAEKNLLKSIALDSKRPQPFYSLTLLYVKKNNMEKAFYYLDKLLSISPHYINQIKFIPELNSIVVNKRFVSLQNEQTEKLKFVQTRLKELGYYNGEADGFFGAKTAEGITEFQKENNINVTGTWDLQTLKKLGY